MLGLLYFTTNPRLKGKILFDKIFISYKQLQSKTNEASKNLNFEKGTPKSSFDRKVRINKKDLTTSWSLY